MNATIEFYASNMWNPSRPPVYDPNIKYEMVSISLDTEDELNAELDGLELEDSVRTNSGNE